MKILTKKQQRTVLLCAIFCLVLIGIVLSTAFFPKNENQKQDLKLSALELPEDKTEGEVSLPPLSDTSNDDLIESVLPEEEDLDKLALISQSNNWHENLVSQIDKESLSDLVNSLANFDDMHLATTSGGGILLFGSYETAVITVSNLSRVRRLLEIEAEQPGSVLPLMREAYQSAMDDWPSAYQSWIDEIRSPEGLSIAYEPKDIEKVETKAIVATYFLGESREPDSIKVLMDGYKQSEAWIESFDRVGHSECAVPPVFTLYAMHRLMCTIGTNSVKTSGKKLAIEEYLSWAEDHVPPAIKTEATTWNARVSDSEPLAMILDPEGNSLLNNEPKIDLIKYPLNSLDGNPFVDDSETSELNDQQEEWKNRLFEAARVIVGE